MADIFWSFICIAESYGWANLVVAWDYFLKLLIDCRRLLGFAWNSYDSGEREKERDETEKKLGFEPISIFKIKIIKKIKNKIGKDNIVILSQT